MVLNLLSKSGKFGKEPENATTDKLHHHELNLLHETCDGDIALHSMELAIQVCCDLTYQSRAQVLRVPHEIIIDNSQWLTLPPSELLNQSIDLQERFDDLGHINDLEMAIAMQRKAIISTPLNNANRPLMLNGLGNSYLSRYDRFGDVKDIDSAITQQFKAVALIPRNSTHRPAILTAFGSAYLCRFERFGEMKDIDSAVEQQLKAAASVPFDSVYRPTILCNLGNSYRCRFERFGNVQDLEFAIEKNLEAVCSISLNDSADRFAIHTSLGKSYLLRFKQFGAMKDIDSAIEQELKGAAFVSPNSVFRSDMFKSLGHSYQWRFKSFGNIQDLEFALKHQLEAVASIPLNHPSRPAILDDLGRSHLLRFEQFGEKTDIDFAIKQLLDSVASAPPDSPNRAEYLNNLGNTYCNRFTHFGEVNDIDSAINHQLEALANLPSTLPNSVDRPTFLYNLGHSYQLRFEQFGEKTDIDFAIKQLLEAVASAPPDSPNRVGYLNDLRKSYCSRFKHFGEVNDIDSAINHQLEALANSASTLLSSADRATFLFNLGVSYRLRFEQFGKKEDIDSAIEGFLETVASIPLDSSKRPECLNILGASYGSRFLRFGEKKDIDLAIKRQLEAVNSTPLESAERSGRLSNLGISFKLRFKHFGDMKDNDISIELLLEAVSSIPLDSPQRLLYVNCLGSSYADRFKFSGDIKDIDLAIKEHLEVVASAPIDSPDRSQFLDQLGRSYFARFDRFGDVKDLDLAIEQELEAIASTSLGSTHRPGFINNLGLLFMRRFQRFREVKDIDFSIENLVEAVAVTPLDSSHRPICLYFLGESYLYRFKNSQEPTDLEESISNFRLSSLSLNGLPSTRIRGSLQWAHLAHDLHDFGSASEAYDQAFRLLPQVAWIGLNAIAQLKELNSGVQTLGYNAAACMIALAQADHHNSQRYLGRAIELLDQGRSILWSQTSNFKQDYEDLQKVDSDLASDLDSVGKSLAQGCFRDPKDALSETDAQLYRRSAEKWEELVHRIRGLPGFHHFLLPSPISTLRTAAAEGPVVVINFSEYRCDAVIVPSQGDLLLVPLPDITATELELLTNQQEEFASRKSNPVWIPSKDYSLPSETLEQLLNRTWSLVGEPIARKFEELGLRRSRGSSKSRVWWCLTGSLSFLPIHASFPPTNRGIGMMDIVVSSYTPTISTLLRAQRRNKLKHPTFRMLAVGQSTITGMTPLPGVREEIAFIQKILGVEALTLDEYQATVDGVAASLPTCSWAHFACHGVQDLNNPMDSGLVMWDRRRLTLSRLAQSSLASAEFAFLSCCESAKGSKQFPNEAMHLAAGLQFIGYRGVIGTLWSVGDKDALSVAMHIYEELFKDGTGQASASKAALALHQAVLLLRADNVPLARWVPFVHFGL